MNETISAGAGVRSRGLRWFAVAVGLAAVVGIGGQVAAPAAPAAPGVHLAVAVAEGGGQSGTYSGEGPNPTPPTPPGPGTAGTRAA